MRAKLAFVVGGAIGYLLGASAGRERYERLKKRAVDTWKDPRVQEKVASTEDAVRAKAPEFQERFSAAAKHASATAAGKVGHRHEESPDRSPDQPAAPSAP